MDTFVADLRQAVRLLLKSPGFTIVAALALALGIGANTALFSVVNEVLLKPLPYADSERIMRLGRDFKQGIAYSTSIPKFIAWRESKSFESIAAYDFAGPGMNLGIGERPQQVKAIHVSEGFFRVFGTSPMAGRVFTAGEDQPGGPRVAVIGYGLWKSRFGGDLNMIGRSIVLNGDPYTLIGVLPASFKSDPPADVYLPLQPDPASNNQGHYLSAAGRLKPGVTLPTVNAEMKVIVEQFRKANPKVMGSDEGIAVVPAQEAASGDIRPALLILLGAVGFVLLIACANVANLLLARAAGRQREIAVRSALGASRWRIVRQLLTESVVLGAVGGILGFLLGAAGVRVLMTLIPPNLPHLSVDGAPAAISVLDWRVLAFTMGIALLTGVVFGIFPALQIARTNVNSVLKEASSRSGTGRRQNWMRSILVMSETALALVLLIGAALMIQTFFRLKNVDPGFDPHNVLTMKSSLAGGRYGSTAQVNQLTRQVLQRIETLPGVQAAAMTAILPVEGSIDLPFVIVGRPTANGDQYHGDENWGFVTPHYFDAFRVRVLRGRPFNENDTGASAKVMIVNEALAKKYFPKEDPIGQRMLLGGKVMGPEFEEPARQIVGVVASVRQADLSRPDQPMMYVPQSQNMDAITKLANSVIPAAWVIRTSAADPLSMSTAVQREIAAVDSQMSMTRILSMEQVIAENISRQNFNMMLLSVFAAMALLLASIGIYGLMSYTVEQRSQEMGIRMALGAGRGDMVRMVMFHGMKLTLIGVALGLSAAYGLNLLLGRLLFGVTPHDPVTFGSVAAILCAVALLATLVPAMRATRVDPLEALRYE